MSAASRKLQQDALGIDFNEDGAGEGFNVSSLLGIHDVPPYGHNGACETLACVVGDVKHRTANGTLPDRLAEPRPSRRRSSRSSSRSTPTRGRSASQAPRPAGHRARPA